MISDGTESSAQPVPGPSKKSADFFAALIFQQQHSQKTIDEVKDLVREPVRKTRGVHFQHRDPVPANIIPAQRGMKARILKASHHDALLTVAQPVDKMRITIDQNFITMFFCP